MAASSANFDAASFSEQVVKPPGMALPDWQILARFGQAMGFSGFQFEDSGAV